MKTDTITIQEVAKLAGVSMMTVSRVIGKKNNVKETTRLKVLEAIEHLNYQPNVSARNLAGSKSYFIGLIYDNTNAAYLSHLLMGALHKCNDNGYNLIISSFEKGTDGCYQIEKTLLSRSKLDGIIIPPPLCDSMEILNELKKLNIPIVRIAPQTIFDDSPFVYMDDHSAAYEMTEHLINHGHKKIGIILGHPDHGTSQRRFDGMKAALKDHKITLRKDYIQPGNFSYKSGFSCAEKLLGLKDRPTAIFASNDDMAAAAISAALKHNLSVPDDISVVGFDDLPLASTIWPQLTTVRQPIMEMAQKAIELLMYPEKTNKKKSENELNYKLIIRDSVAKLSLFK